MSPVEPLVKSTAHSASLLRRQFSDKVHISCMRHLHGLNFNHAHGKTIKSWAKDMAQDIEHVPGMIGPGLNPAPTGGLTSNSWRVPNKDHKPGG